MLESWQQQTFEGVNDVAQATPWLHAPALAFAEYGVAGFALLLLAGWWLARHRDHLTMTRSLLAPLAVLVAVGLNQPIVNTVREARPYTALPKSLVLVSHSTDFSFPSDHAVMAGAVAAGLWLVDRRLGLVAAALAVLMAATRVYVGAHYPGDVLAGLALGAAVAFVFVRLFSPLAKPIVARLSGGALRPLFRAAS